MPETPVLPERKELSGTLQKGIAQIPVGPDKVLAIEFLALDHKEIATAILLALEWDMSMAEGAKIKLTIEVLERGAVLEPRKIVLPGEG